MPPSSGHVSARRSASQSTSRRARRLEGYDYQSRRGRYEEDMSPKRRRHRTRDLDRSVSEDRSEHYRGVSKKRDPGRLESSAKKSRRSEDSHDSRCGKETFRRGSSASKRRDTAVPERSSGRYSLDRGHRRDGSRKKHTLSPKTHTKRCRSSSDSSGHDYGRQRDASPKRVHDRNDRRELHHANRRLKSSRVTTSLGRSQSVEENHRSERSTSQREDTARQRSPSDNREREAPKAVCTSASSKLSPRRSNSSVSLKELSVCNDESQERAFSASRSDRPASNAISKEVSSASEDAVCFVNDSVSTSPFKTDRPVNSEGSRPETFTLAAVEAVHQSVPSAASSTVSSDNDSVSSVVSLEQKKLSRLERIKKLMEAKKCQRLLPPLPAVVNAKIEANVCENASVASEEQSGALQKNGGVETESNSTAVADTVPVVIPPEILSAGVSHAPVSEAPVAEQPSLSTFSLQDEEENRDAALDAMNVSDAFDNLDPLDAFMAAIATEVEELEHSGTKRRNRGRGRRKKKAASQPDSTPDSAAKKKSLSITLDEILALQQRQTTENEPQQPADPAASASTPDSRLPASSLSFLPPEPNSCTPSESVEAEDYSNTAPVASVTPNKTEPQQQSSCRRSPLVHTEKAKAVAVQHVEQAAEAEDDAYYQEFIAAMRRQQATADATPSSSEKSNVPEAVAQNLDLPVNARGPPGGDSAEVNDEHESEQEDDNNILDNPDDEDYRYNVAEDDGSQSYFDLVQKVGNKKELPAIDHSAIDYLPFEKNLYVQVREITLLKEHEVDALRKLHGGIRVRGKHCPRPIRNFYQCGLPDAVLHVIEKREYESPFPIQMQGLPTLMAGRDVIGIAETGSGKTLAYLLPLIRHVLHQPPLRMGEGPIGLVLAPTRELAVQIQREAHRFSKAVGLRSTAVYGGTGIGEQLSALKRGAELVIATPGRLIDVLTINSGKVMNLRRVTFCVLDEADRMFDLGFEPQITSILQNIRPDRQTALFSATFPPAIETLARRILRKPIEISVGDKGQTASRIEQYVEVWAGYREKFLRLLQLLGEWNEHGSIIIFVSRQNEADELFAELLKYGYPSFVLHGGQDQTDRDFTIQDFKDGAKSILVATSVAARGLDVKAVVLVINFVAPDHLEDYVHRIGRTGRAGNIGVAYTFLTPQEGDKAEDLIKALTQSGREIPEKVQQLADEFRVKCNMGLAKQQKKKGFGGKGFKFTASEKSRQQQERQRVKKEMGMNESDNEEEPFVDAEELENPMAPMPPTTPVTPTAALNPAPPPVSLGGDDVEAASARAKALAELIAKQAVQPPSITPATAATVPAPTIIHAAAMPDEKARQVAALRSCLQQQLGITTSAPPNAAAAAAVQRSIANALAPSAAAAAAAAVAAGLAPKPGLQGCYLGVIGTVPGLSSLAYIDQATGNAVDEFDINDYPQYARFKITHKDVLHSISDQTGAVLQVKGRYVSPEEKESPLMIGVKRLYIEIIGATPIIVQRAKHEIRTLLEAISLKQLNVGAAARPPGRYSVI